jgi:hypothetical protein
MPTIVPCAGQHANHHANYYRCTLIEQNGIGENVDDQGDCIQIYFDLEEQPR